jgi:hypothetical protein
MSHQEQDREEHPSYGMVGFSRISGNPGRLFGSPLKSHESFISLRVGKGARIHELGYDRFHGGLRGGILEVILSAGQFSELLTTMNIGSGVPCTIRYINGVEVPKPPEDAELEVEKVRKGFTKDMKALAAQIKKNRQGLDELLAKDRLTKEDRKRIAQMFENVEKQVELETPFMIRQFEEASEKVVKHAKAEVDAFITGNIIAEGLRTIKERAEAPQLPPKGE